MRVHYLEWDAPSDHTVFLLHGFLDLAEGWRWVAEHLAGRAHLIAPDWRGHGDSGHLTGGGYYHFADYISDLDGLVRAVGRARVSIAGHSMGGMAAAMFTGTFPERIHRLAILEGLGPPPSSTAVDVSPERTRLWVESWNKRLAQPPRGMTLDDAVARIREHDPRCPEDRARQLAEAGTTVVDGLRRWKHDPVHLTPGPYPFRLEASERFWAAIRCPVLLVDGAESNFRYAPPEAERRLAVFKDARRATIPEAGHMMLRHQPATVAAELAAFLFA
jgi:pimeloyl-ACP methyl ester carboxylesterase